jgi:hypothetical protein
MHIYIQYVTYMCIYYTHMKQTGRRLHSVEMVCCMYYAYTHVRINVHVYCKYQYTCIYVKNVHVYCKYQ